MLGAAEPGFDRQCDVGLLRLGGDVLQPAHGCVYALGVLEQISLAEEGQQDDIRPHRSCDVDGLVHPPLRPGIALVGDVVEDAHRQRCHLQAVVVGTLQDRLLTFGIEQGQLVLAASEVNLNAIEANPLGDVEGFRLAVLAQRPVTGAQFEAGRGAS